jgi:accessory gene regulator B
MDISERIAKSCIKFIANNLDKSEEDLEKIEYGIQVILVNTFKLIVLFLLSFILGNIEYTFIALISFSVVRMFASGVHADSNLKCTITNIIIFLGNVYISENIVLRTYIKIIIFSLSFLLILLYAPADTEDRPLVSRKLRIRLKVYSAAVALILGAFIFKTDNSIYSNLILFSLLEESVLITPIAYGIFKKSYRNYEKINLNS